MSATLCWYPPRTSDGDNSLSTELRFKLQKRFEESASMVADASLISYLEGLVDCNVPDAQKLIDLIEKYGSVTLKWEY